VIGSRNLDLGIVVDADGDGTLNVVIPTNDRSALGVLKRDDSEQGVELVATVPFPGQLTTNVAVSEPGTGDAVSIAIGTSTNTLRIWPGG